MAGFSHEFSKCVSCGIIIEQRAGGTAKRTCSYECNLARIISEHQARHGTPEPGKFEGIKMAPMENYIMQAAARMVAQEERKNG